MKKLFKFVSIILIFLMSFTIISKILQAIGITGKSHMAKLI